MSGSSERLQFWKCARCGTQNPQRSYLRNCVGCGALAHVRERATPRVDWAQLFAPVAKVPGWVISFKTTITGYLGDVVTWCVGQVGRVRSGCQGPLYWVFVCYLIFMATVMLLAWTLGDRWYPATLLLYSPRVLWLIPLLILMGITWFSSRRALLVVQTAVLLGIGLSWGGFQVPVERSLFASSFNPLAKIRVLSFNGHYGEDLKVDQFVRFLESERIDVVCLQEFHRSLVEKDTRLKNYFAKWHWDGAGYIVSRLPIVLDRLATPDRQLGYLPGKGVLGWLRLADGQGHEFEVMNLYLPSLRSWFGHFLVLDRGRMNAYETERKLKVANLVKIISGIDRPLLVAGDVNTAGDSPLFRPFLNRFRESFETSGWGIGSTFPSSMPWIGIDHILVDRCWRVNMCKVGADLGSDHRPMVAELDLLQLRPTVR